MPHLAQLLATHGSILVIDAASLSVQIGLLQQGKPWLWATTNDEAGRGLFQETDKLLHSTATEIDDVDAFVFCEGPGSMLGTRTVAMALRTWTTLKPRPVFSYQSLAVAAVGAWSLRRAPLTVIADARREAWHVQQANAEGGLDSLTRRMSVDLPAGILLVPSGFRTWSQLPHGIGECSYQLSTLFGLLHDRDLFRAVNEPDVLTQGASGYKKWAPLPHSAETIAPR